jgi:hypothetical protein
MRGTIGPHGKRRQREGADGRACQGEASQSLFQASLLCGNGHPAEGRDHQRKLMGLFEIWWLPEGGQRRTMTSTSSRRPCSLVLSQRVQMNSGLDAAPPPDGDLPPTTITAYILREYVYIDKTKQGAKEQESGPPSSTPASNF